MRRLLSGVSAATLALAFALPADAQVTPRVGQQTQPGFGTGAQGQIPLPDEMGAGIGAGQPSPGDVTGQTMDPTMPGLDDGAPGLGGPALPDTGLPGVAAPPAGTIGEPPAPGALGQPPATLGGPGTGMAQDPALGGAQDPTLGGVAPGLAPGRQQDAEADTADVPETGADEPLDATVPGIAGEAPGEAPGEDPLATGDGTATGTAGAPGVVQPEGEAGTAGTAVAPGAAGPESPLATGDGGGVGAAGAPDQAGTGGAGAPAEGAAEAGTTERPLPREDAEAGGVAGQAPAPDAAGTALGAGQQDGAAPGDPAAGAAPGSATAGEDGAVPGTGEGAVAAAPGAGAAEEERFALLDRMHEALGAAGVEDRDLFIGDVFRAEAAEGAPVFVLVGPEDFAPQEAEGNVFLGEPLDLQLGEAGLAQLRPDLDRPVMQGRLDEYLVFAVPAEAPGGDAAAGEPMILDAEAEAPEAAGLGDALAEAGIETQDDFEPMLFRARHEDLALFVLVAPENAEGAVGLSREEIVERLEAGLSDVSAVEDVTFVRGMRDGTGLIAVAGEGIRDEAEAN